MLFRSRIAAGPAAWVSRGDGSGTYEREMQLWDMAGVRPQQDRLIVSGRSMAVALRHTQETQGYTLADEATFWQIEKDLDLKVVFEHDERLLNTYGLIHPRDNALAQRFGDWLTTGAGREKMNAYRIEGRQAFTVWPASCPGHWPGAMPCGATR